MTARSFALVLALAAFACGGQKIATTVTSARPGVKPLYDRLGGVDAISDIVTDLVEERIAKDPRISARFGTVDRKKLEKLLTDQICEATGGPCKYTGRAMKDTHVGLGITDAELSAFFEDLKASLDALHLPKAEADELIRKLETMRDDIVDKKS